jgi:hypothetical protein
MLIITTLNIMTVSEIKDNDSECSNCQHNYTQYNDALYVDTQQDTQHETFSIMKLGITTRCMMTLSTTTLSIMALSKMAK